MEWNRSEGGCQSRLFPIKTHPNTKGRRHDRRHLREVRGRKAVGES